MHSRPGWRPWRLTAAASHSSPCPQGAPLEPRQHVSPTRRGPEHTRARGGSDSGGGGGDARCWRSETPGGGQQVACALPGGPRGQLPWHSCCEARQRRSPPGPARPNSLPLASGRGRKLKTPISLAQGRGSWNEPIKGLLPQLKFAWKLLARCSRALRPSQLRLQTLRRSRNPERNGPAAAGLPQVTQGKPGRY